MLKVVIIDDEPLAIEELKYLLNLHAEIESLTVFNSPSEGECYIHQTKPDLVFLDIQMPRRNGIEIAKAMQDKLPDTKIIFVTAYDAYALDAFEVHAFDYLLKPISSNRLNAALSKILSQTSIPPPIAKGKAFITLYKRGIYEPVKLTDIIYCHSDEGLVTIYTAHETYQYNGNFCNLNDGLDAHSFFRCHRSFIINLHHIEKIEPTERAFLIKMHGHETLIPVARSNSNQFKKVMSIY